MKITERANQSSGKKSSKKKKQLWEIWNKTHLSIIKILAAAVPIILMDVITIEEINNCFFLYFSFITKYKKSFSDFKDWWNGTCLSHQVAWTIELKLKRAPFLTTKHWLQHSSTKLAERKCLYRENINKYQFSY